MGIIVKNCKLIKKPYQILAKLITP